MKTKYACFILGITLIFCGNLYSEVTVSQQFQNVLEKLAKQQIREKIVQSLDPLTGIVAADLIDQVLNSASQDEIVHSAVDVATTMAFLTIIADEVDSLVQQHIEVIAQAKRAKINRSALIAYSALYYYYSERIKYNLYVSPKIYELVSEKKVLESIQTESGRAWVTEISSYFIRQRRVSGKYQFDVRIQELFNTAADMLIFDRDSLDVDFSDALDETLNKYSEQERQQVIDQLGISDVFVDNEIKPTVESLFALYTKQQTGLEIRFEVTLLQPLQTALHYDYINKHKLQEVLLKSSLATLESMVSAAESRPSLISYTISLAGTVYPESQRDAYRADFTLLDQIRLNIPISGVHIFLFTGGFIDPILKSTLYDEGLKYYLAGVGLSYGSIFFSGGAAIPYPEFHTNAIKFGVSLGYEIPIMEVFGQ